MKNEDQVNKQFADEVDDEVHQLKQGLKDIGGDAFFASQMPSQYEMRAMFVDRIEALVKQTRGRVKELQSRENDPAEADLREITALRNLVREHATVLAQFEQMAYDYQRRDGRQNFSAIGELMGSILHGERVWGEEGDVVGEQVEAWCNEPVPGDHGQEQIGECCGDASAPINRSIDAEMKARAIAEVERHERRQVAKDEQNIRLSAASIARDVLGPRSTTPSKKHHEEFFDLAKEIAGWLTNGAS